VEAVVCGAVSPEVRTDAEAMAHALTRYAHEPVLHARVRLTRTGDPARERPVIAQVNLDVNGRFVRAQAAGHTAHEALDLVHDRARRQLDHLAGNWPARRSGPDTAQDHPFPRPAHQPTVIRHKAYRLNRSTPDRAALDMDLMDYDFHLFTDAESGRDAVLYRAGPTGYRIAFIGGPPWGRRAPTELPVTISPRIAPLLSVFQAMDQLNGTSQLFLFFADLSTGEGRVLYRRYDGHYGLVTPTD
jgi:hypothetical protein